MIANQQPTLAELTSRALASRSSDANSATSGGDVEPYEVLSGIRIDAAATWTDAQLPLQMLGLNPSIASAPPEWATFVEWNPGRLAIPMAAGHFPQRLREIAGLFSAELREAPATKVPGYASLRSWIARSVQSDTPAVALLAGGIARELGDSSPAWAGKTPVERNESAAQLWQRGNREGALELWQQLPASAVASFNIGMAQLFLGNAIAAVAPLNHAATELPENTGWQHLAALYLSVAQVRQ